MSVARTPENYKGLGLEEEAASGGPAAAEAGDARWLLRSPDEDLGEWLDRIRARLASAWQASDPRDAYRRGLWGRALILAQARLFGGRDEWRAALEAIRPVSMTTEDNDDDGGAEAAYAVRCAYTARSFPEVAAAVLGLDVVEVCRALAVDINNTVFTAEEAALVGRLSFREFWRRRGNPQRARAELLALARRQIRRQEQEAVPEIACQVLGPGATVTLAAPSFSLDAEEPSEAAVWNTAEAHPKPACQVLPSGDNGTRAVTQPGPGPEKLAEAEEEDEDEGESMLLRALLDAERRAADAIAGLVRVARLARAEDQDAADSALMRTLSLLADVMPNGALAEWEIARLIRRARETVEAAEDRAAAILAQADAEAEQLREAARREAEEARQAAAAAAATAYAAAARHEVMEKVRRLVFDRYRLHLPAEQGDGLDGYRQLVRTVGIARRAIPVMIDAAMARLCCRAGADLESVMWHDYGAQVLADLNVGLLARLAEAIAAAVPDMALAQEYQGLADQLVRMDYPQTASGFVPIAEILASSRGEARDEARAAVAAARAGRGRPVIPVAP